MNELLLSEINSDEKSLLQKIVLVEEFVFSSLTTCLDNVDSFIEHCQSSLEGIDDPLEQAEQLINELFVTQLLIDSYRDSWPVVAYQLHTSLDYRTIAPSLKVIIIRHIIEACGFDCDIVFVPEKVMVRLVCDDMYAIIFDPVTGESLNWQEFDLRMAETEDLSAFYSENMSDILPESMTHISLIVKHLSELKAGLIKETHYNQALKCVDILLALSPNDPFERRDRGFLLHQLDCFKVAVDDYRYFVEQCPKDPAAQLLKIQLDNITIAEPALH
jgi:regulator of sirC expression with transglutaminase-like and TPR domain